VLPSHDIVTIKPDLAPDTKRTFFYSSSDSETGQEVFTFSVKF